MSERMRPASHPRSSIATRRDVLGLVAAAGTITAIPAVATAAGTPAGFIQTVGDKAVAVLDDPALARDQKLQRLIGLLNEATNMPLVARLVLGKYWRQADAQQQQAYVDLFEQLVIKTMATQLSNYGGETFEIVGSRDAGERDTVVSTRILRPTGAAPFNVDWRVRAENGRFMIVDIVAEGISMVVSQRSEVTEIVSQKGIDGLIAAMRERLDSPAA